MAYKTRNPTGDDSEAGSWSGAAAGTRYTLVDDHPDTAGADNLVHGTTAGNIAFTYSAFDVPATATVNTVSVHFYLNRSSASTCNMAGRLKVGGSYYNTSTINLVSGIYMYSFHWNLNPKSGVAWTVDDVNGVGANGLTAFGTYSTDANPTINLYSIQLQVDYTVTNPGYAFQVDTGGTLNNGLMAYYKLESDATDSSDNERDSTLVLAPSFTTGIVGNGCDLEFSSSQYIAGNTNIVPYNTQDFSFSFWAKHETTAGTHPFIMCDRPSGQGGFWLYYDGTNIKLAKNNGATSIQKAYTCSVNWTHFVCVFRSSGTWMEIYINGASYHSGGASAVINHIDGTAIGIGTYAVGGTPQAGWYFDGVIDEIGFWCKSLVAQEITDLYNGGSGNTLTATGGTTYYPPIHNLPILGVG